MTNPCAAHRPGAALTDTLNDSVAADGTRPPVLPHFLDLAGALSASDRHAEAAVVLRLALADAGPTPELVAGRLVDELIAAGDPAGTLLAAVDVLHSAPVATSRALAQLRDTESPRSLPALVTDLTATDWVRFARDQTHPVAVRSAVLDPVVDLLHRAGRHQEAISIVEAVPGELADDVRLTLILGKARAALRRRPAAEQAFRTAHAGLAPTTAPELAAQVRLNLAIALEADGRIDEAGALVRDPSTPDPKVRAQILGLAAVCLVRDGVGNGAEALISEADQLAFGDRSVITWGAWVLLGLGNLSGALERAHRGLRRFPASEELAFLRLQAEIGSSTEPQKPAGQLARLLPAADSGDLDLAMSRSRRMRADLDPALHYFVAVVFEATDKRIEALVRVERALDLIAAGSWGDVNPNLDPAVRLLRARLLEQVDPERAASDYARVGTEAFFRGDWEPAFELLKAAERLGALDQSTRWFLAESYLLSSYSQVAGAARESRAHALQLWNSAFAEGLPDPASAWVYITRGRLELQAAADDGRAREHALLALLFAECTSILSVAEAPLLSLYAAAFRLLGLYGLSVEIQNTTIREQNLSDAGSWSELLTAAANAGDLELFQVALADLKAASTGTSWHEAVARRHLMEGDPRAALVELEAVAEPDRTPLYFEWMQVMAYAAADDGDGVRAVLDAVRPRLTAAGPGSAGVLTADQGIRLLFWLVLGEPESAAALLDGFGDAESWFTDAELEKSLAATLSDPDPAPELEQQLGRFVATTRSFEDLSYFQILLRLLRSQYGDRRPAAAAVFERLQVQAEQRVAGGGWPLAGESDLTELRKLADDPELAAVGRTVEQAVRARRDVEQGNWSSAADRYRELLDAAADLPEAEQGLILAGSAAMAATAAGSADAAVASEVVDRVSAALPGLDPARRRRPAPATLEIWLADAWLRQGRVDAAISELSRRCGS